MKDNSPACPVCLAETFELGSKRGTYRSETQFSFRHCPSCHFSFVANPCLDFLSIYDEAYYRGKGADPYVDYVYEIEHPEQTIRVYEWRGIFQAVRSLTSVGENTAWLDFGCGNGGLVLYCLAHGCPRTVGFEEGWIEQRAREKGVPLLDTPQLEELIGKFDIVTAIEVLEHLPWPIGTLKKIRALLKPGGLFFLTTGNARPYRGRILEWRYVVPEVHVSFFEPATLELALKRAGFRPERRGYLPEFTDIIRYKILKSLRVRRRNLAERLLPWSILTHLADRRYGISDQPVGWAL